MLYQIILSAFCVIVVISNIISAKLFTLPFFELCIPAGLITYPLSFLLSDLVTEIYGAQKAKIMVYTAFGMSFLSFAIIQLAILLPAFDPDNQYAFQKILGLNGISIFSSLTAYLISQIVDIKLYVFIRHLTSDRFLWLRNNGSTLASQIVDTAIVNIVYLYWGFGMEMKAIFPIMCFSYLYKAVFSISNTPLFYLSVFLAKRWNSREMQLSG